MFHPADDSIPLPEWRQARDSEQENFAWPPIDPRFGQRVIRGTVAVPVYEDGRWSSKRVGTISKEALVDEAVSFFRKSAEERDELRKEDENV